MGKRSNGYFRAMKEKKIKHKERIIRNHHPDNCPSFLNIDNYTYDENLYEYHPSYGLIYYRPVKHRNMLSKGKYHCSCEMCAFHGTTQQDRRILSAMKDQLTDYIEYDEAEGIANASGLKNKLSKKINGRYYPNCGIAGSRAGKKTKKELKEQRQIKHKMSSVDYGYQDFVSRIEQVQSA